MNLQRFFHLIGEAIVTHAVVSNEELQQAYLEWARAKWPRLAGLEETLYLLPRQKFYRQEIWDKVSPYINDAIPRDADCQNLLFEPAELYFQVVKGEYYGLTSGTIGQMRAHAVPRLIQKVKALQLEFGEPIWDDVAHCIGEEFARLVKQILDFRTSLTDQASVRMFLRE